MSQDIESRVVQMKFDNSNFEKNTRTTLSTLDKLKSALHFGKEVDSFSKINDGANHVNLTPISKGVEKVQASFSALQVAAFTVIQDITRTAEAYGKRIVSALTIDPVRTGFQEYETQINAVQTILANTSSKGTTLDQVNSALDELNTYADKTIYNFTEMTRNIGTFTAAGVDLDTSVQAIKGIANLAAVSGSTSQQASTAMYQLSQALAAGSVKLMDWNSVVNAGMGGQIFQDSLKETARAHGVAIDDMIKKEGSFRETLQKGWLTSQILTETLAKFTGDLSESQLRSQGYTANQIKEIQKLGKMSNDAATKVKTFTQLVDTLKESAQSGWTQTWELIIGDFDQAKELFTKISDTIGKMIGESADARNAMVSQALSSKWDQFEKQINDAGIKTDDYKKELAKTVKANGKNLDALIKKYKTLDGVMKSGAVSSEEVRKAFDTIAEGAEKAAKGVDASEDKLKYFQKVVTDVWRGDYKNGQERVEALTKAGYNYNDVQKLVNMTVDQHKLTLQDLSDAQLQSIGYTKEEIEKIRLLALESKKANAPFSILIDNINQKSGRELLVGTLNDLLSTFANLLKSVKNAWSQVFPANSGNIIYNAIKGLNDFVQKIKIADTESKRFKQLVTIFKALFKIVKAVTTILGGGFKAVWYVVKRVLGAFNIDVLDLLEMLANGIIYVSDWISEWGIFTRTLEPVCKVIEWLIGVIKRMTVENQAFMTGLKKIKALLKPVGDAFAKWFKGLESAENIGQYLVEGLINGIVGGIKLIFDVIVELATMVIQTLCSIWKINSPSKETFEMGYWLVMGLVEGIKDAIEPIGTALYEAGKFIITKIKDGLSAGFNTVKPYLKTLVNSTVTGISELLKGVNWDVVKDVGQAAFGGIIAFKGLGILENLTDPLEGLSDALEGFANLEKKIGSFLTSLGKSFKKLAKGVEIKFIGEAVRNIALSILILVGSVYLLTLIDPDRLWDGVLAVTELAACVGGLIAAVTLLSKNTGGTKSLLSITAVILSIGITIGLLTLSLKSIADMGIEKATGSLIVISALFGEIIGLIHVTTKIPNGSIKGVAATLIAVGITMRLMLSVAKSAAKMPIEDLIKGIIVVGLFGIIIKSLIKSCGKSKLGEIKGVGPTILAVGISMVLMSFAVKMIGEIPLFNLIKGVVVVAIFGEIIKSLISELGKSKYSKRLANVGSIILKVGIALILMSLATKILGSMDLFSLAKGIVAVVMFGLIIKELIKSTKKAGPNAAKAGATILLVSGALFILSGVVYLLSFLNIKDLAKGIIAIGLFGVMIGLLIKSTKDAKKVTGNIVSLTVMIVAITACVWLLSTIPTNNLVPAVASILAIMGMAAFIIKSMSSIDKSKFISIAGSMVAMEALLFGIIGVMVVLSSMNLNSNGVIKNATAMSIMLISLSISMVILSKMKSIKIDKSVIAGLVTLSACFIVIAVALGIAQAMNVQNAIPTAIGMSTMLIALSTSMVILSNMNKNVDAKTIGAVAGLAIIMAGLAFLFSLMGDLNIGLNIELAISLGILINALAIAMIPLGFAGKMGLEALLYGVIGLAAVLTALAVVFGIVGGIVNMFGEGGIKAFETAVEVFGLIGEGIGKFVGGIIEGIGGAIIDLLPKLGTALSEFMINATAFIVGIQKLIGPQFGEKVLLLTAGIGALLVVELLNSIISFLSLGNSTLPNLGTNLSDFANNAADFFKMVSGIKPEEMQAVKMLAEAMLAITAANLLDNIAGFIGGKTDFEQFGKDLSTFGKGVANFSSEVSGKISSGDVETAANAGATIAGLYSKLPKSGGVMQKIFGESMNLDTFGKQLKKFGYAMVEFSKVVKGKIATEDVTTAANAGATIAGLYDKLPKTNGWAQKIFGETTDLSDFADQLTKFGEAIVGFSATVDGQIKSDQVETAANAGATIAGLYDELPKTGGLWSMFEGAPDFGQFNKDLEGFGTAVSTFASSIKDVEIQDSTLTTCERIGSMMNILYSSAPTSGNIFDCFTKFFGDDNEHKTSRDWDVYENDLEGFAKAVSDFCAALNDPKKDFIIDKSTIDTFVNATSGLVELIVSVNKAFPDVGIWESFENFVAGWFDAEAKKTVYQKFVEAINWLLLGVMSIYNAMDTIKNYKSNFIGPMQNNVDLSDPLNYFSNFIIQLGKFFNLFSGVGNIYDIKTVNSNLSSFGTALKAFDTQDLASVVSFFSHNYDYAAGNIVAVINELFRQLYKYTDLKENAKELGVSLGTSIVGGFQSKFKDYSDNIGPNSWMVKNLKDLINIAIKTTHAQLVLQDEKTVGSYQWFGKYIVSNIAGWLVTNANVSELVTKSDELISKITSRYDASNFKNIGVNLIKGIVAGMSESEQSVDGAAITISKGLLSKVCTLLGIHSPSTEFAKIGRFSMMGFAKGIRDNTASITEASGDAGKTALDTVNDYCYQIANHINDDFNPRIKPVLDLTEVANGSKMLPSMFNGVGIDTNMQARIIASELSYRGVPNQNGTTNEMASEIKMLREDMYNIVDAISGLEMRMDSGELVGAIAKPMDSALGARARMLRRS